MGCLEPDFLDLLPDEMIHNRKLIGMIDKYILEYKPKARFYSMDR